MDDVLHTHAERVAAANAELVERMGRIRGDADAQMREKLSAFGARLLDLAKDAESARIALLADLTEIAEEVRRSTLAALDADVAEAALSTAAMRAEIEDRTTFMATGVLPASLAKLPGSIDLAFRDDEGAGGEIIVLPERGAPEDAGGEADGKASA